MMGMSSLVGMMMIGGGGGGMGKKKGNGGKGGDDDDVPFFVEYRPDLTADEDEEEGRVVGREGGDDDDDDDDYDDDDDDGINGKRRMTERLSSAIRGAAWKGWKNKGGKGVRDDYIDIDGADDRRSPSRSLVLLAPPPPHNPPRSSSSRPPPPPSSSCSPHPHRNLGALIFGDDAVSNNRAGAGEMMYTVRAAAAPPRLFWLLFRYCIPHIVSLHGRSRSRRRRSSSSSSRLPPTSLLLSFPSSCHVILSFLSSIQIYHTVDDIVCIDSTLGIYVCESGLSASDCINIIRVADETARSRGGWSSYTYAKQTLGCRESDRLAFVCARPVLVACATIRERLACDSPAPPPPPPPPKMSMVIDGTNEKKCGPPTPTPSSTSPPPPTSVVRGDRDESRGGDGGRRPRDCENDGGGVAARPRSSHRPDGRRRGGGGELVLDAREPHVVKYDTLTAERRKLDMHTDKSEWTFLIALTDGGMGRDYIGGGTFFQALNSTVHLRRSQMLVFRGRLRHCGVTIQAGCRYLLVGFLVPRVVT